MYLAHALIPDMLLAKKGVIIVTGNTAAKRGVANTPYFAPTKAAQRILAQSLAKDFGPKGIHVAYLIIDAFINTPWTRTRIEQQFNKPDEIFTQPKDIAEEIYHIAHLYLIKLPLLNLCVLNLLKHEPQQPARLQTLDQPT